MHNSKSPPILKTARSIDDPVESDLSYGFGAWDGIVCYEHIPTLDKNLPQAANKSSFATRIIISYGIFYMLPIAFNSETLKIPRELCYCSWYLHSSNASPKVTCELNTQNLLEQKLASNQEIRRAGKIQVSLWHVRVAVDGDGDTTGRPVSTGDDVDVHTVPQAIGEGVRFRHRITWNDDEDGRDEDTGGGHVLQTDRWWWHCALLGLNRSWCCTLDDRRHSVLP